MSPPGPAGRPWAGAANPLGLTELDVATGVVLGTSEPAPWPPARSDPLDVLFDEANRILRRGHCVVAFSGGRDSSAVLALLLHVARRDGLEEPVALTARWPGDLAADESAWQEHVAGELEVRRWEVITPGTDFDLLGPLATGLLREHGLLWPAPTVALMPMIEAAGDGVLVTGQGGDEVFGTWSLAWAWARVRRGRNLPSSLRPLVGAAVPRPVRLRRAVARAQPYQSWLTPEARALQNEALASETIAVAPLWWPDLPARSQFRARLALGDAGTSGSLRVPGWVVRSPPALPRFSGRSGAARRTIRPRGAHGCDAGRVLTPAERRRPEPAFQSDVWPRVLGAGKSSIRGRLGW